MRLEILTDKETILVEKLRMLIIEMIHYSKEWPKTKYSDYISKKLQVNYTYLSKIFSRINQITIEHFIISNKIERVKQLLLGSELTLTKLLGS
jgi:YesN/AraC family two-component response regulator